MSVKENLAKVDKKVWVKIGCVLVFLAIICFLAFTHIGHYVVTILGSAIITAFVIALVYKLYVFILKKLGLKDVPPDLEVKFSIKMVKREEPDEKPEVIEVKVDTSNVEEVIEVSKKEEAISDVEETESEK